MLIQMNAGIMKSFLVLVMALAPCLCKGYEVQYKKTDSIKVVKLLNTARSLPASSNKVIYFAKSLLGIPYVA